MVNTNFYNNVYVISSSSVAGPNEKQGPLGIYFDYCFDDMMAGTNSFFKGEAKMIETAIDIAISKTRFTESDISLIIGGDLSNQLAVSHYALKKYNNSFIGIYGACSTSILGMINGSIYLDGLKDKTVISYASSHYSNAEKTFRYPLEYGIKKKVSSTTTVTGCGCVMLSNMKSKIEVISSTIGKVIDVEWNDGNDMGSVMSMAAYHTILNHLNNENSKTTNYDLILTGDLSKKGSKILVDLFDKIGIHLDNYMDAGNMIYNPNEQKDVYSGGSGCACLALVGFSYILEMMIKNKYKDVLLVGTGCLHSKISLCELKTIPVIAHAIHLRRVE